RGWTPKAYKEREIPIPDKLVQRLKAWKAKSDKTCGLVFPTAGCNPKLDFLDCCKAVAKRAGWRRAIFFGPVNRVFWRHAKSVARASSAYASLYDSPPAVALNWWRFRSVSVCCWGFSGNNTLKFPSVEVNSFHSVWANDYARKQGGVNRNVEFVRNLEQCAKNS